MRRIRGGVDKREVVALYGDEANMAIEADNVDAVSLRFEVFFDGAERLSTGEDVTVGLAHECFDDSL